MTLNDNEVTLFGSFTFDDVEYEFLRHVTMPCEDEAIMVPAGRYLLAREKVVAKVEEPQISAWDAIKVADNLVSIEDGSFSLSSYVLEKTPDGVKLGFREGMTAFITRESVRFRATKIFRNGEVIWQRK